MAQTLREFLSNAANILHDRFDGDEYKLPAFIQNAEFVVTICEPQNDEHCFNFIKSRLKGDALNQLPPDIDNVEDLLNHLKQSIKPQSSAVIEGKLMALRLEKSNYTKFMMNDCSNLSPNAEERRIAS